MKKKLLIGAGVLVGLLLIAVGYFVVKDLGQEKILDEEMSKINNLDLLNDKIDMTIKTTGDYAVVEKTIKDYLNNYKNLLNKAVKSIESDLFVNAISIENYKADKPKFEKTINEINRVKKLLNDTLDELIELSSDKTIMKKIEDKKLDDYYIDYYKKQMFGDTIRKDFQKAIKSLEEIRDFSNKACDLKLEIINMLAKDNTWYIENDELYMANDSVRERYNLLVDRLNNLKL